MISGLNGFSSSMLLGVIRNNSEMMEDLTVQIGTGKKSQTYGGLGGQVGLSLDLRAQISTIKGFQSNIEPGAAADIHDGYGDNPHCRDRIGNQRICHGNGI